ncbi:MAG: hypothetical protein HYT36_01350 [Candidatus Staskawiczbacteria bacterium]|nr:hypothetical protein [Candidatus Staskawiczbacteria bacterium]
MTEQKNNMRVIFTDKANLVFDDIIKNFNLEESIKSFTKKIEEGKLSKIVIVDHLAKDFAREIISEKDLTNSLQKDLEISPQIAEQVSKEIINKIVPLLEKFPEERFVNPMFREEISKKIFENQEKKQAEIEKSDVLLKIKPPISVAKILKKEDTATSHKEPTKINKPTIAEKTKEKEPTIKPNRPKKQDVYREPIE